MLKKGDHYVDFKIGLDLNLDPCRSVPLLQIDFWKRRCRMVSRTMEGTHREKGGC